MKIGCGKIKIIAFFMALLITAMAFSVTSFSEETEETPFYKISCVYDVDSKSVKIEYRMKNDDVKKYENADIVVYALPFGATVEYISENELEPVSKTLSASSRYTVEVPVTSVEDRLSAYVLAIKTQDETVYSETFCPTAAESEIKSDFKGIESDTVPYVAESMAETVILEIKADKLDGGSSGYLYSLGNRTYTFSSEYLSEIDKKMKIYGGAGSDVYLRLVSGEGNGELLSDTVEEQIKIYACVSFLCSRYSDAEYGGVAGFVLGNAIENGNVAVVNGFAASLYSVAAAIEDLRLTCPIIMPITGTVDGMKAFLNDYSKLALKCALPKVTVMTETDRVPYAINESVGEAGGNEIVLNREANAGYVSAENVYSFENYVKSLANHTGCVYTDIVYHWTPDPTLSADDAVAAYVYNYFKLYFERNIAAYVISFDGKTENADYEKEIIETVKYIDSDRFLEHTDIEQIRDRFGFISWDYEIGGFSVDKIATQTISQNELSKNKPNGMIGYYRYFDFSSASELSGWYEGGGCNGISSGKTDFGKCLTARFCGNVNFTDFIVHNYKYSESFKYTDTLSLDISFDSVDDSADGGKYGVYIILGGDGFRIEYFDDGFEANKKYTVYADVSQLSESNVIEYIRVGAVSESHETGEYKMNVYSMGAESSTYDSEELSKLIESERERLMAVEESSVNTGAIVFIVITALVTAMIMIMISKKTGQNSSTGDQN